MALTDNLIAYYKLDGNSTDSINGFNGTDTTITYNSSNGKINQGAGFNGSTSVITLPITSNFNPTTNFSINCWIKVASFSASFMGICDKYIGNTSGYYIDIPSSANKQIQCSIHTSADKSVTSSVTLVAGTWYMVTMTYDGSNLRLYINANAETPTAATGNIAAGSDNLTIGGDGASTNLFNGAIDEFSFWNGKALSQTEITQLYNNGAGIQYPFSSGNFFFLMQ